MKIAPMKITHYTVYTDVALHTYKLFIWDLAFIYRSGWGDDYEGFHCVVRLCSTLICVLFKCPHAAEPVIKPIIEWYLLHA